MLARLKHPFRQKKVSRLFIQWFWQHLFDLSIDSWEKKNTMLMESITM